MYVNNYVYNNLCSLIIWESTNKLHSQGWQKHFEIFLPGVCVCVFSSFKPASSFEI